MCPEEFPENNSPLAPDSVGQSIPTGVHLSRSSLASSDSPDADVVARSPRRAEDKWLWRPTTDLLEGESVIRASMAARLNQKAIRLYERK
uniref:Uncharacterized protein n=1 Tax=Steinernema glaseri TaxID=37863 RepID=A0A1I7ZV94_9BILA